jgi:anti-anti-sigma regulatory factor
VVFSFFGKKQPAKSQGRAAGAVARKPVTPPPPPPPATEAGEDLDFTNFLPNEGAPASPRPTPGSTTPAFLPTSAMSIPLPDWIDADPGAAPPAADTSAATPSAAPREEPRRAQPVDSILCIEVESSANDVPQAIEETAILFANGQSQEALARICEAIATDDLGAWHLQAWLMLFDLQQHLGMRTEFEDRALEFVVRFERSPPVWSDPPPPAPTTPATLRTGGAGHVALTGGLTAASAPAIEHLRRMLEKQPRLRLDLGRLNGIDGAGARLLLDTLTTARKARKDLYFTGEAELLRLVQAQAAAGDRGADPALWLLALEIAQQLGDESRYEDLALEYTVTYEVSPPAWEKVAARAPVAAVPMAGGGPDGAETFVVAGDIAGGSDRLLADLEAFAGEANPVVIDLQHARRVDFVSAGQLLNLLARLKQAGKSIEIRGANQLVVALFAMMGIRELARLVARK